MNITGIIATGGIMQHRTGLLSYQNIPFPTTSGSFSDATTTFKFGPGAGFGVSNLTIPANTAGRITCDYQGLTYKDTVLGLDLDNTLEGYTGGYNYGIVVDSGSADIIALIVNGVGTAPTVSLTGTSGDILSINVTAGGAVTAEVYRGGSWTVIYTFTTSTALKYIKGHVIGATNYLLNPKLYL